MTTKEKTDKDKKIPDTKAPRVIVPAGKGGTANTHANKPAHPIKEDTGPSSKIDWMIRRGLAGPHGFDRIVYYRRVMQDPKSAVSNPQLRPYMAEIQERLLKMILSDSQLFNRVITILNQESLRIKEDEASVTMERLQRALRHG